MSKQARDRVQIIDTQTTVHPVGGSVAANDTMLRRIVIHTALAGTLTIAGFKKISDGTAVSFVFPIGFAAGSYEMGGLVNDMGQLTASLSSVTDASRVMIVSQPIGQLMT